MIPFYFALRLKTLPETKVIQSYKLSNSTKRFEPRYHKVVDLNIRDEYYDIDSEDIRHGPDDTR